MAVFQSFHIMQKQMITWTAFSNLCQCRGDKPSQVLVPPTETASPLPPVRALEGATKQQILQGAKSKRQRTQTDGCLSSSFVFSRMIYNVSPLESGGCKRAERAP